MKKRAFKPVEGVSNIELFYDLIFVYCISVLTSLCHHPEGDFLDFETWFSYGCAFAVVMQVWFFTTFLLNRYGDRSAGDNICLFINMFLLYFLASGIQQGWESSPISFNVAWALILLNLIVHWADKRLAYTNLDDDDKRIMNRTIVVLALECAIVLIAAFTPVEVRGPMSIVGLLFGAGVFTQSRTYRRKPARFGHLAERCALLVIVAFGETIVALGAAMGESSNLLFSILAFALVVGLFLIYIYEHDNMLDHHADSDGLAYMTITGWIVFIIGNLAIALEYMPEGDIAFLPKSIYITTVLVVYLVSSFLVGRFNKPAFRYSAQYIGGRIATCAIIVVVAVLTNFDPLINMICDTAAIFFALWHEWLLYHVRCKLVSFGRTLGDAEDEDADEHVDGLYIGPGSGSDSPSIWEAVRRNRRKR